MRKHVQTYQNEVKRYAQNAEQPITCLKGPITKDVHIRVHQLRSKFFPTREPEAVQDGICYLKVIIDCYHCNARPATAKVKKQLSRLHMYMREAARGEQALFNLEIKKKKGDQALISISTILKLSAMDV